MVHECPGHGQISSVAGDQVRNPTVIVTLLLCLVSLAGVVLMIEELNRPLEGLIRVSGATCVMRSLTLGSSFAARQRSWGSAS